MKSARPAGFLVLGMAALLIAGGCARPPQAALKPAPKPAARTAVIQTSAPPQASAPAPEKRLSGPAEKTIIPDDVRQTAASAAALEEKSKAAAKDQAAAAIEEALSLYQESKQARERDDLDGALRALDEAYGIILKIQLSPDSPYQREKADLRLLIAQRIQEIYASRRRPMPDNHKAIPLIENKWVQREIESFRGPERKYFEEAYRRSGFYRAWIVEQLRTAGLPEELSWLPIIESFFMPRAQSYAWALGMWQFIGSTGAYYGLARDRFIDERMDPYKSTRAAIKYLTDLHGLFGEWTTALAAYNCGEGFVQRVIATQHIDYLDNFWDLFERLPYQTARYVPRFIATILIIREPGKYGFELPEPYPALVFDTVAVDQPVKLAALSSALGLDASELAYLNPELRNESTPDRSYPLRVPAGSAEKIPAALAAVPRLLTPAPATLAWHVVQAGETLARIAGRYGTTVAILQKLNGLRDASLKAGQRLKVPVRG
jgi:membrane-bound lytic murein transglycosylase D